MKKFLIVIAALVLGFLFSSFGQSIVYPFYTEQEIDKLPDINTQKAYAIMDAADSYTAEYADSTNPIVDRLANALASNMIVEFSAVQTALETNEINPTITVYFIDYDRLNLENNTAFEFAAYSEYIPQLSYDAMEQVHQMVNDKTLYTKEYQIGVSFKDMNDSLNPQAILSNENLNEIQAECYIAAEKIYSDYLRTSDISTAFFCKSIKELSVENIVDIYNANNPENQIEDEWQKRLFADYAAHYIDNLVIQNIIKANTSGETSTGTINYQIEHGNVTIENVLKSLLDIYYTNKQTPIERELVIGDFGTQIDLYNYTLDASLYAKSFDFTYSQDLNEFRINDDFYNEIVNDIYEEFILFEDIFAPYYTLIENLYFFVERPFNGTLVVSDNTGESRYRQLDIVVTGTTDCYVKLYKYDTVNDILTEAVYIAYIKAGESLQVFIPEGDYIFKYATGTTWYGDVYMFSDEGQYFMGSDVISVHEYMMTTTINLGTTDSNIPVNSQTPDLF